MCDRGEEAVVALPDWVVAEKQNRTVSIDKCIASVVTKLWDAGFATLGSCCGHGKEEMKGPNVICPQSYKKEKVDHMADLLKKIDPDRSWTIFQWQLTSAAVT